MTMTMIPSLRRRSATTLLLLCGSLLASMTLAATTKEQHSYLRRAQTQVEPEMMVEVILKMQKQQPAGGTLVMMSVEEQQQEDEAFFSPQAIHALSQRHQGLHVQQAFQEVSLLTAMVPVSSLSALEADPAVSFVEPNGLVYQNGMEHAPYGVAMTLGTTETSQLFYNFAPQSDNEQTSILYGQQQQQSSPSNTGILQDCPIIMGIVDGGLDVGHYDFEFCGVMDTNGQPFAATTAAATPAGAQKCIGKAFLESTDIALGADWYNPTGFHGTHVAGTIAASGLNNAGIRGMMGDEQVCLVFSRIFTPNGSSSVAKVVEAMLWTMAQGVSVMNLSLGTEIQYAAIKEAVDYAEDQGVLLIASAGNGADKDPPILTNYPADYDNVVSVSAVDEDKNWAEFSNYNKHVNIAAPGSNIHSTIPRKSLEATTIIKPYSSVSLSSTGTNMEVATANAEEEEEDDDTTSSPNTTPTTTGVLMEYSRYVGSPGISGVLMDCQFGKDDSDCIVPNSDPNSAASANTDGTPYICILSRGGEVTFYDKAMVCKNNGGVGVIVYNNQDGGFQGSMGTGTDSIPQNVDMPVVGISRLEGEVLLEFHLGQEMSLENPLNTPTGGILGISGGGYGYLSGTSMAAPHVAGAAGLIWRACPSCKRDDVWGCLSSTAEDLGDEGRDDYFGEGLVQADLAFQCLLESSCCTAGGAVNEAAQEIPAAASPVDATKAQSESTLILV